jgi:drug/metabolite transporter (DMT)-like permease
MIISILGLTFAILGTALGQFFYKRFFLTKNFWYLILTLGCLGSVPVCTLVALKNLSLDTVYVATSITIGLTTILAVTFLNERLSRKDWFAIGCIISGVIIYNLSI